MSNCALFLPTSLFTERVCVYAYTEPLGQHAGISELFLFIYLIFFFFLNTFPNIGNRIASCLNTELQTKTSSSERRRSHQAFGC